MRLEPIFVDTWGWLALGHRQDPRHLEVKRLYQELRDQRVSIYTSDYVLDEAVTLLFRREVFSEAVRFAEGLFAAGTLGHLIVERVTLDRFSAAWRLKEAVSGQAPDFVHRSDLDGHYARARYLSSTHGR
jgi:predicted nucleic acid-binding protein